MKLIEKEKAAIECMRIFNSTTDPYYICYSGGKDSDVIRILAEVAGVNYEIHHNHTSVDSPTTVRYIRETMKEYGQMEYDPEKKIYKYGNGKAYIHLPERTMWELIEDKTIPPTRLARYCCAELKEKGGRGRKKVTGVRWDESRSRKEKSGLVKIIGKPKETQRVAEKYNANFKKTTKDGLILNNDNAAEREVVENCYRTTSTLINPIIDWTDKDVWDFLKHYGCDSNPGYCEGEKRIGCIGCPMSGKRQQQKDFEKWPTYRRAYVRAFDKMIEKRKKERKRVDERWKDGERVMRWWLGDDPLQITYDDYMKYLQEQNEAMQEYFPPEIIQE